MVKQLLAANPDLINLHDEKATPLHYALRMKHDTVAAALLAFKPEAAKLFNSYGETLLHEAVRFGAGGSLLREIWQAHPEAISTRDFENSQTPFHLAVVSKNEAAIEALSPIVPIDQVMTFSFPRDAHFHRARRCVEQACTSLFSYVTPWDLVELIVFAYLGFQVNNPQDDRWKKPPNTFLETQKEGENNEAASHPQLRHHQLSLGLQS